MNKDKQWTQTEVFAVQELVEARILKRDRNARPQHNKI